MPKSSCARWAVAALFVVGLGWAGFWSYRHLVAPKAQPAAATALSKSGDLKKTCVARATKSLDWADGECRRRVRPSLRSLDALFGNAKENTPGFAQAALGWSSKWRLLADYVPLTRGDRHERFLRRKFEQYLFTSAELQQAIERSVREYLTTTRDVENQMLVRMRQDLADLPGLKLPPLADSKAFRAEFDRMLREVQKKVGKDLAGDAACLVGSEVASQIAMQIAERVLGAVVTRLGVSGGILAVGAESGAVTFGAGMVVGLVVDWLVGRIWDWYADPRGQLVETLDDELDELHLMLVRGNRQQAGLQDELAKLARGRDKLRRQAVLGMIEKATSEQ